MSKQWVRRGRVGLAALAGLTAWNVRAQMPRIISVGAEEMAGVDGRLSSIAVDSKGQPHIACDGGSFVFFYDKINGRWNTTSHDVAPAGSRQYYNPRIEIDSADTAWTSGILWGSTFGIGLIARPSIATGAPPPVFAVVRIQGVWDSGNLSLDPSRPGEAVVSSSNGHWHRYRHVGSTFQLLEQGQLYAGQGGEKNAFWISKASPVRHADGTTRAVWHGAIGGYYGWYSSYQNSVRAAAGLGTVTWAAQPAYPAQDNDGTYVSCVSDKVDPLVAYITSDFGDKGVCMNIYNGTAMQFDPSNLLVVDLLGRSGLRRFAPQLAPALGGGVFACWTRGSQVLLRFIGADGTMGPETVVGAGALGSLCVDADGHVHVAYNNNGIRYRKLTVYDPRAIRFSSWAQDFDGDGLDDLALYRSSTGTWHLHMSRQGFLAVQWGTSRDIPMPADYDGDGKADLAVYRPAEGKWYVRGSLGTNREALWGAAEDIPMAGDHDGDGKADYIVYRPSTQNFHILGSRDYQGTTVNWGLPGDQPVCADYDGDGRLDIAIFRPSNATWYWWGSTTGYGFRAWGASTDLPVPADYDGDGKADVAVFRASTSRWYVFGSRGATQELQWGSAGDIPIVGHFDSDAKADIGTFRPSQGAWYIRRSRDLRIKGFPPYAWGAAGDQPVVGDFNGDGICEVSLYRPSTGMWHIVYHAAVQWGAPTDIPAPGDYDGDRKTDCAVYRPSNGTWYVRGSRGSTIVRNWGAPGDLPVPADYNGDGVTDRAIFRPSTGEWFIEIGAGLRVHWGAPGDKPLPADYDGDGKADVAVFRRSTSTWHIYGSRSGSRSVQWGAPGDLPVPGHYDADRVLDLAVFRPSTGVWYLRLSGSAATTASWGAGHTTAVPADYDGDGLTDLATFRTSPFGAWWVSFSASGEWMEAPGPIYWGLEGDQPVGARYTR